MYKNMREGGGGGKFLHFFGQKLIFLIDLKIQKKLGQSDKRSRSNSPSQEKGVLWADRVKVEFDIILIFSP